MAVHVRVATSVNNSVGCHLAGCCVVVGVDFLALNFLKIDFESSSVVDGTLVSQLLGGEASDKVM